MSDTKDEQETKRTGRKINRTPATGGAAPRGKTPPPNSKKAQAEARRNQLAQERLAAAEKQRVKKETEQRVAEHLARKKELQARERTGAGAQAASGTQGGRKQGAASANARNRKQQATATSSASSATKANGAAGKRQAAAATSRSGKQQGAANARSGKQQAKANARGGKQQAAQATRGGKQKNTPHRGTPQHDPNHAPIYNQYDGTNPAQAEGDTQKKRGGRKSRPLTKATIRRRKRIANFVAALLVVAIVVIGIVCSVTLIFKVKTIELQSPTGETEVDTGIYTEASILAKLDSAIEDNFVSFSTAAQEQILQEAFPLLDNIEVVRDYPDTIVVCVEPAVETYTMQIASGWVILSEQLHVMSTSVTQPDLLWIVGATPSTYVAGQSLAFTQEIEAEWYEDIANASNLQALLAAETQARSDAQIETLVSLIDTLEEAELLSEITAIDFDGVDGISFLYQDRIAVLVGTSNSISYKLDIVRYVLQNENGDGCASTDTGLLDVSYQNTDGTITTVFSQGVVTFPLVSGTTAEQDTTVEEDAEDAEDTESEDDEAVVETA